MKGLAGHDDNLGLCPVTKGHILKRKLELIHGGLCYFRILIPQKIDNLRHPLRPKPAKSLHKLPTHVYWDPDRRLAQHSLRGVLDHRDYRLYLRKVLGIQRRLQRQ